MRQAFVIVMGLLVQLGLCGRLIADGACCAPVERVGSHCHAGDHDHGHAADFLHVGRGVDADLHDAGHPGDCPADCGEHHHHHGVCIHGLQMSCVADEPCRLAPPRGVVLCCDRQQMRVPEGPVMEMDKPPLI